MAEVDTRTAPLRGLRVPWGLLATLGGFLLAFSIFAVGANALALGLEMIYGRHFVEQHSLPIGIAEYQFLALGVAAAALLILHLSGSTPEALGFRFPGWNTLVVSASLVVVIVIGVALISAFFTTFIPQYHLQGNARELLNGASPHWPVAEKMGLFVWAAVEAPLVEETLFRGILFQGLRDFFAGHAPYQVAVLGGALISGVLFGLVHGEPHTLPILVFLGVALAYIFHYSHSVYASALVHGIINATAVITLLKP